MVFSNPVVGNGPLMGQALIPSRRDPERGGQDAKKNKEEESEAPPLEKGIEW